MVGPFVGPRIEEINFVTGFWINAREIGTLEGVASIARISEPTQVVVNFRQVLLGNNVLDMKWDEGRCLLWHATILAPVTRSSTYQVTCGSIHL